ncbi:HAD family hydrolase [Marinitenerispora sediminis]|uniref:Phosphatase n=1 Tax=Marinitenerispora sediminis TaxID=1931232 RepID=A0A368T8X5_9ACTN|nr:HAD family hydrolase [Marinitenerispora sediminis]RCV52646.1 phosphatase [Marinitenerispora sediminis]RCV60333.1 phosphatase [Marinitenerispora sediminis]RCV60586.1 phosphatase [Marinitenerispora sediminis]
MGQDAIAPPNGITHIVWDWNGTLLDDNHANLAALNQVCAEFGRAPVELEYWRAVFRRPLLACYEELFGRPLADEEWARLNQTYDRHYSSLLPSCRLADGALQVLTSWTGRGRTQSLLSMAAHRHLEPLITERGLTRHFTRVDGRRHDGAHDSKAEHLVQHLEAQGISPSTVALIGDIDDDARAAREAGAHAVLVATGLMSRARLEATGHPVADSAAEAVAMLGD